MPRPLANNGGFGAPGAVEVPPPHMVAVEPAFDRGRRHADRVKLLLNGDPAMTVHTGGWEPIDLIGRRPATEFVSPGQRTLDLPCAIDQRLNPPGDGDTIEKRLERLRALGAPIDDEDGISPPVLRVACATLPLAITERWVMTSLTLGAQIVQGDVLVRQDLAVSFAEWVQPSGVHRVQINDTRTNDGARRPRTILSLQGDTLHAIGLRKLGSASQWKDIRKWNPKLRKLDPDVPLEPNTRVVLK